MEHYSVFKHMCDVFDREARKMPAPLKGRKATEEWQKKAREVLKELLSIDQYETCDLRPKLLSSEKRDGYRMEKIEIQTEPDVFMPFYLMIPDGAGTDSKRAAFLIPHGHGPGKMGTIQEYDKELLESLPRDLVSRLTDREKDCLALTLVKHGYIVAAPDARGSGERREYMDAGADKAFKHSHTSINNLAISLGMSMCGMQVWDLMRLADYVITREEADGRIGAGGMSGGGQQTLFFAACDERVECAIVSGWFYGFKESLLLMPHNCGCNFVPNLWRYFDCGDLGSLIAPRNLYIESGENDHLNGSIGKIQNVISQVDIAKASYRALEAEDRIHHYIHPGVHEWSGKEAYDFVLPRFPAVKLQ